VSVQLIVIVLASDVTDPSQPPVEVSPVWYWALWTN